MKSSDEMINDLFERREQYTADKKRKRAARLKVLIPVCAACLVALIGAGIWKSGLLRRNPGTDTGKDTPEKRLETLTAKDLTAGSSGSAPATKTMGVDMRMAYEEFAYKLFAQLPEGKTRMISPFSIYVALSMLANGAEGETLAQLDELLGLTAEERNAYLAAWIADLTKGGDGATTFSNADSLWIYDAMESGVPKEFLDICAQYYRAAVYSTPMDDSTVADINAWVKAKTMDMIDELIDSLPANTAMVLMNAIALDAAWEDEFDKADTKKDCTFTRSDGTTEKVDMMYALQEYGYMENDLAIGFSKKYKGFEFTFMALLPREGVTLHELLTSLTPQFVHGLRNSSTRYLDKVHIAMPKYEQEYSLNLNDILKNLGMTDAFDGGKADFHRLMTGPDVWVDSVSHKTHIKVDEKGTQAEAATDVIMSYRGIVKEYYVTLDRPFVYMILDSDGLPIFIGTYEGK
ncbi:MAG: serpin family protein [Lachnospiraceae bacterium]|nr:serpin family protein [Lachnospiraceae bacterium]